MYIFIYIYIYIHILAIAIWPGPVHGHPGHKGQADCYHAKRPGQPKPAKRLPDGKVREVGALSHIMQRHRPWS